MLGKNQRSSRPQMGHLQQYQHRTAVQWQDTRQRTSVGFKLAVRGDSGAGGLVAPLPCTAYFGKLAKLLASRAGVRGQREGRLEELATFSWHFGMF